MAIGASHDFYRQLDFARHAATVKMADGRFGGKADVEKAIDALLMEL